ncbi:MAG: hypothetical protein R2912_11535 [Eubacteriales bacterium]
MVEDVSILFSGPLCWRKADQVVDMRRNAIMPAFIDLHCHLRDPDIRKETMEQACARGAQGVMRT